MLNLFYRYFFRYVIVSILFIFSAHTFYASDNNQIFKIHDTTSLFTTYRYYPEPNKKDNFAELKFYGSELEKEKYGNFIIFTPQTNNNDFLYDITLNSILNNGKTTLLTIKTVQLKKSALDMYTFTLVGHQKPTITLNTLLSPIIEKANNLKNPKDKNIILNALHLYLSLAQKMILTHPPYVGSYYNTKNTITTNAIFRAYQDGTKKIILQKLQTELANNSSLNEKIETLFTERHMYFSKIKEIIENASIEETLKKEVLDAINEYDKTKRVSVKALVDNNRTEAIKALLAKVNEMRTIEELEKHYKDDHADIGTLLDNTINTITTTSGYKELSAFKNIEKKAIDFLTTSKREGDPLNISFNTVLNKLKLPFLSISALAFIALLIKYRQQFAGFPSFFSKTFSPLYTSFGNVPHKN